MYSGNKSKTFGTGFLINRKYKYKPTVINLEAVDERSVIVLQ
jgi:hypothetical protein